MGSKKKNQNEIALFLALFMVTLYFNVTFYDPFNLPKMLLLGFFALFGVRRIAQAALEKDYTKASLVFSAILILFLVSLIFNFFLSDISSWQFLMGSYQRNLGFLTYSFFAIVALWTALARSQQIKVYFLNLLVLVGAFEVFYGLIQNSGKDLVSWKNPYSPIIGSFGNPNYMSAFLGLTSAASVILVFSRRNLTLGMRSLLLALGALGQYLCVKSSSIQGTFVFVAAISSYIAIFLYRKYRLYISLTYLSVLVLGAAAVVIGLNNKGPLASLLYQTSISARGDYWRAALLATKDNPFGGLGMDNFGEVYLKYRDVIQVQNRGFGTFANNAHNSFLQFASTTGVISALLLILVILYVMTYSLRQLLNKSSEFDAVEAGLLSLFISCLPIMMISIDNIGFSIWFWGLCGLLVFKRREVGPVVTKSNREKISIRKQIPNLIVIPLASVFFWFSIQVSLADIFLRDVFQSESKIISPSDLLERFEKRPVFLDKEEKYLVALSAISFGKNWFDESEQFADLATKLNPQGLDGWRLTALSNEGMNQTEKAVKAREVVLSIDQFRLDNMLELTRGYLKLKLPIKARGIVDRMERISPQDPFTIAAVETLRNYRE